MKIHACLMTQNELSDLVPNLEGLLPHVDTVTVVDGGSTDGTIPYLRNWSRVVPRLRLFIHPWADDFPAQRNNYLRRVQEIAEPGDWLLAFDPDEYVVEPARLRGLVEAASKLGYGRVGFQCRSVSYRGPARVWENIDQFWKCLLICWVPGLSYFHHGGGPVHEDLAGAGAVLNSGTVSEVPLALYEHRKQENIIWVRGARNYFCGGGGPNLHRRNPFWIELREWCAAHLGIPFETGKAGWAKFHAYLLAGNVDPWLKDWMFRHRLDTWKEYDWTENGDGSSEQREFYKTYYRLYHPEEEPDFARGEHIP